jgi:transposase-like protein
MSQEKRKFTKEEKLQIYREASEQGGNTTLNRHGIYSGLMLKHEVQYEHWFSDNNGFFVNLMAQSNWFGSR